MFSRIYSSLYDFFERNLFERIVIYISASFLLTTILFQLILGQDSFGQSQNQQWIFYAFLGLDYLLSLKKVINIKVTINPISVFAFALFIMMGHGLFVGIVNHNPPFVILNDTVPILMIALNILRMQSIEEISKPINFKFLAITTVAIASATCFFSFLAGKAIVGSIPLFYPLALAALLTIRPFPKWIALMIAIIVVLTIEDTNRTILLLTALVGTGYLAVNTIYHPTKTILLGLILVVGLFSAWSFLPEDSKTYQRIVGITELDLSKRTGSIGERQAERDAIHAKLQRTGKTAEWTGAGFGGLYNVQFTHTYNSNYGHAHYAWAWFNLRFGKIGYIYMFFLLSTLLFNGIRSFQQKSDVGLFVSLLCLSAMIYSFTHVNSIFLLSGLHFLYFTKGQINDRA